MTDEARTELEPARTASDENGEFSDNLGAGVVVTMPKKGKK